MYRQAYWYGLSGLRWKFTSYCFTRSKHFLEVSYIACARVVHSFILRLNRDHGAHLPVRLPRNLQPFTVQQEESLSNWFQKNKICFRLKFKNSCLLFTKLPPSILLASWLIRQSKWLPLSKSKSFYFFFLPILKLGKKPFFHLARHVGSYCKYKLIFHILPSRDLQFASQETVCV